MLMESGMCCCCQDDRDILKALNKAQADRIKQLEDKILAYKEQKQIDLAVKKDLDEKLDKATADYRALWVENDNLKSQLVGAKAQCENTVENRQRISELSQTVINLREEVKRRKDCGKKLSDAYTKLMEENAELQKKLDSAEKESDDLLAMYDKAQAEAHQAHVAKDRMGYSNRCMQSKIAKQSNEIKRLTRENVGLVIDIRRHKDEIEKLKQGNWDEMERLQNANAKLEYDNFQLKQALGTSAKDADANFERGHYKGQEELWEVLQGVNEAARLGFDLEHVYGYNNMSSVVANLTASAFLRKTKEDADNAVKNIQLGDEVEIFDEFDHDLSDIGIVIAINKDNPCFAVIGPNFEGCFDETDIQNGNVRKTGQHFDSIPLDYFA